DPEWILKQASLRRPGSAGTVSIIGTTVARTHEQSGLREPAHGTAEMRAVNGKHLKGVAGHVPDPARNVGGLAIPGTHERVAECRHARLAFRELAQRSERH